MRAGKSSRPARGFTFVAVLVLLALCMLGLSIAGPIWSEQTKREREQELIKIGGLYAQAIADYRDKSPGSAVHYPENLEMLLLDTRFVGVQRYLRKLYGDPMNPGEPWGLIFNDDKGIVGVYSLSEAEPIAQGQVKVGQVVLPPAKRYSDWKFTIKAKS